jgi:hypothetical protein
MRVGWVAVGVGGIAVALAVWAASLDDGGAGDALADAPADTLPPLDAYVRRPAALAARHVTAGWRGTLHAARDVLFPEFRDAATATNSSGLLDRGFPGETAGGAALRRAYRDRLLAAADAAGLPHFHARHPDVVRYGMAAALGAVMLALLAVVRAGTAACARAALAAAFAATKNDAFCDDEDGAEGGERAAGEAGGPNVFNRMWEGPVEYEWDPRLTPEQKAARAAARAAGEAAAPARVITGAAGAALEGEGDGGKKRR